MLINEMFDKAPEGHYDEKADNNTAKKSDSRGATRLTLSHLNAYSLEEVLVLLFLS